MRKESTREQLLSIANTYGWSVQLNNYDTCVLVKRRKCIVVTFSVRGSVTSATTNQSRFIGIGKAERVLAYLCSAQD